MDEEELFKDEFGEACYLNEQTGRSSGETSCHVNVKWATVCIFRTRESIWLGGRPSETGGQSKRWRPLLSACGNVRDSS